MTGWRLRVLSAGVAPAMLACRPAPGSTAELETIVVTHAAVSAPPVGAPAPAFLRIANRGTTADTLLRVSSPEADSVILHTMVGGQMEAVAALALPAGDAVRLRPGSYHLMLEGVHRPLAVGDSVTLLLQFAAAGELAFRVPVLRYSDATRD